MSTTETGDKSATPGSSRPKSGGYVPKGPGARPSGPGGPGSSYGSSTGGPGGRMRPGGRPPMRRRVCRICMERQGGVDWKAANFLRNFITDRGKILSGRATGTCSKCQRQLTRAIKRARNMALVATSPF